MFRMWQEANSTYLFCFISFCLLFALVQKSQPEGTKKKKNHNSTAVWICCIFRKEAHFRWRRHWFSTKTNSSISSWRSGLLCKSKERRCCAVAPPLRFQNVSTDQRGYCACVAKRSHAPALSFTRETPTIIDIIKRHFFNLVMAREGRQKKAETIKRERLCMIQNGKVITQVVIVCTPGCLICW